MTNNNKQTDISTRFDLDKLSGLFEKYLSVSIAYLFGSALTGVMHEESDIDIAVLFDPKPDFFSRLELTNRLCDLLGQTVDLALLNDASPIFKMQVISKGKLIFCRNSKVNSYFVMRTVNEYDDLSYYRKIQEKNILKGRTFAG